LTEGHFLLPGWFTSSCRLAHFEAPSCCTTDHVQYHIINMIPNGVALMMLLQAQSDPDLVVCALLLADLTKNCARIAEEAVSRFDLSQ